MLSIFVDACERGPICRLVRLPIRHPDLTLQQKETQFLTGVDFPVRVLSYMVAMAMAIYRLYIRHIWAIHKLYISHVQPTVQATDGP